MYIDIFWQNPEIESGCYNAGFENLKIKEIAELVKRATGASIKITESNDPRSYRQNSSKLIATGFKPRYGVQKAIEEITDAYKKGDLPDGENCYTVKWMKQIGLDGEKG